MSRKLVVLDLNGSLLLRAKGNRHVWARPYFQSFLGYLFHPTVSNPDHGSKAGLEVMIWSSAQPHSVNFMVDSIFASRKSDLLAIWDRSHFGLTKLQYENKYPTMKDLRKTWRKFPQYSAKTTILLDDSVGKALLQPDNHICLVEYTAKERARDVKLFRDNVAAIASTTEEPGPEPPYDDFMLATVGILEEIREKDDVSAWLWGGGLRIVDQDQTATLQPGAIWFEDPGVLEYWVKRGKATLDSLQIPIDAGVTSR